MKPSVEDRKTTGSAFPVLRGLVPVGALLVTLLLLSSTAFAQIKRVPDIQDSDCTLCHDGMTKDIPGVTTATLEGSPHEGMACLECHVDLVQVPHPDDLAPVRCEECHSDVGDIYTTHGVGQVGVTADIPRCTDCHGSHEIRPSSDPTAPTHPDHMPAMCGRCHSDVDLARKHDITLKQVVEMYESSVHGVARSAGDTKAPTCTTCHGTNRSAHQILARGNSQSAVNHFNIPGTCGQCHGDVETAYWDGIHGKATLKGDTHAPVCTDCHGEHGILPPDDPRSNVSSFRVAEATCTPCHETARINESFNLPAGTQVSFVDSFHGLKSRRGDSTVANCASCHEAHKILPSSDPQSSVNPANLQTTCGHCHQGITEAATHVQIHGQAAASPWVSRMTWIYIALIVGVIGGMIVFVSLDFRKHMLDLLRRPQIQRMDKNAVFQHTLLMVSFTVLVLTGFALRYSSFPLFSFMFGWDGGFQARGLIHRVAAAVFLFGSFWHVFYLFTGPGRGFLSAMAPGMRDLNQVIHAFSFNLGLRKDHPYYGKFSFVEKAEYWALVWGTVVMAGTGLLLWFRNLFLRTVSGDFLDVMRVIHLYEAWLATLAILIWHFYGVIFKPGVFPGNPSWVTGNMPVEMFEEEHPEEADQLRAAGKLPAHGATHGAGPAHGRTHGGHDGSAHASPTGSESVHEVGKSTTPAGRDA